jgi:endonuclease III
MSLPSVGRKTANCVLVYGFDKPAIPVDTHVHRIANRLGLVETKTPEETEAKLVETVPKRYWLELNELFVRFGQTTCKPIGPKCGGCTLTASCKYYKEVVRPKQVTLARAR